MDLMETQTAWSVVWLNGEVWRQVMNGFGYTGGATMAARHASPGIASDRRGNTLDTFKDLHLENGSSQGQHLALTGVFVPFSTSATREAPPWPFATTSSPLLLSSLKLSDTKVYKP